MMQYDKEFHLYLDSWDVYRKMSVERNKEKERVEEFVCVCVCVCMLSAVMELLSVLWDSTSLTTATALVP